MQLLSLTVLTKARRQVVPCAARTRENTSTVTEALKKTGDLQLQDLAKAHADISAITLSHTALVQQGHAL